MSYISKYKKLWSSFFEKSPLFLYGIFFLLGTSLYMTRMGALGGIALALFLLTSCFLSSFIKTWGSCLFFFSGFMLSLFQVQFPSTDSEGVLGIAYFKPLSFKENEQRMVFSGTLKKFMDSQGNLIAQNIPITLSYKHNSSFPPPSKEKDWIIKGSLKKRGTSWRIIPQSHLFWKEVEPLFSWVYTRHQLKIYVEKCVKSVIPDEKSAHFISGMLTGSFFDPELSFAFQRFGLQHILAISGFHFSLLSFILALFLRPHLQGKPLSLCLFFCLTLYLAFLGLTPSILRAWTMITLSLLAPFVERSISPFNALGAALIVTLLYEPCSITHIGFILSFAITFSILIFTNPIKTLLDCWLLPRSFLEAKKLDFLDQSAFIVLSLIKNMLAVNGAVHIIAVPLLFASFGAVPLFSLLFNLFFPLLAGGVILLFAVSTVFIFLFYPLGKLLFSFTSMLTSALLHLSLDMPYSWNIQVHATLPLESAALLIFGIACIGIFLYEQSDVDKKEPLFF